ncbi:glycosyltransferase [Agrobacterium pusense]|uniref:glycosyltransferase n=1 Tax=Agrobacterium pusense TaxID=648995 RepID=UPI0021CE622A|nr:glycosyltransferase [Agrobacterium pusense]UXT92367.1 glycosyltransferase [Agrobacterium pusense]
MENDCKLTVVTATRNNSQDLIATAKSIREQLNRNFEWLVYDGSDQEDERLKIESIKDGIAAAGVPRVRMVHRFDNGIYEAMNNAVTLCEGEFVIFLNCGDMFVDERTMDLIQGALAENVDVLHGDEIYIESDGTVKLKTGMPAKDLVEGFGEGSQPYLDNMVCQQAIVYRTSVLRKNPMSLTFRVSADHDYFFDLYSKGYQFSYIDKPLCIYFAGGFSFRHPANCYFDWLQVQAKYSDTTTPTSPKSVLKPFRHAFRGTLNLALLQREQQKRRHAFGLVMRIVGMLDTDSDQAAALDRMSRMFLEYSRDLNDLEFWTLAKFFAELVNRVAPSEVADVGNVHIAVLQILDRIQEYDETKLTAYEVKLTRRLVEGAARYMNAMPRLCMNGYKHLDTCNLSGGASSVLSAEQNRKVSAIWR